MEVWFVVLVAFITGGTFLGGYLCPAILLHWLAPMELITREEAVWRLERQFQNSPSQGNPDRVG
ncbi:hypothetical protein [Candidatus Cyanaurora vandensis]|uniref:hypothetical protein n=1 Tax=Candidatus Cyanaurora vandensis TaxID=2714958 RepID=UPI00257AE04A|nr:hypothetical protein [Candidatus Cyanaurora vandensis]